MRQIRCDFAKVHDCSDYMARILVVFTPQLHVLRCVVDLLYNMLCSMPGCFKSR